MKRQIKLQSVPVTFFARWVLVLFAATGFFGALIALSPIFRSHAQDAEPAYSGFCMVRSSGASIPAAIPSPDAGAGYAKVFKGTFTAVSDLLAACSDNDFGSLLTTYCASNSEPVMREVVLYDSSGAYYRNSSASQGSSYVSCPVTAPLAPSGLTASFQDSKVILTWTDNSGNESGFKMYKTITGLWTDIGNVSANTTTFTDSNVTPGSSYQYRMQAFTIPYAGAYPLYSGVSSSISVTVPGTTTPTPTPTLTSMPIPTVIIKPTGLLAGTVTDEAGVPSVGAAVHVYTPDYSFNRGMLTTSNGGYSLELPAGNYVVEAAPPSARVDLLKAPSQTIGIMHNETSRLSFVLPLQQTVKTISGSIRFSSGIPVTDARVHVYNEAQGKWLETPTNESGAYKLIAGYGTWKVAFKPRNPETSLWQWQGSYSSVTFNSSMESENRVMDFIVPLAEARVRVVVTDASGVLLQNVGVVVQSLDTSAGNSTYASKYKKTDAIGTVLFYVTSGTYSVSAYYSGDSAYVTPDRQQVNVSVSRPGEIQFVFRPVELARTNRIEGSVKKQSGETVSESPVWAWSEQGGTASVKSAQDGSFSLDLAAGQRWHIGAAKEVSGVPYKSAEMVLADAAGRADLVLVPVAAAQVAETVVVTQEAIQPIFAVANDGASVSIPAGAAGSNGTVNVELKPTVETPSQPQAVVVGSAYEVTVKDTVGSEVKQLSSEIELTLPYDPEHLLKQGVKPDQLVPSYFDEASGVWVNIENYTINKTKNTVIVRVSHLTRFALVAPADVTAPVAPINLQGARSAKNELTVIWTDPAVDFHHAKVYRSTSRKIRGELMAPLVTGSVFKDGNLKVGRYYYYTVVAVDAAGNESEAGGPLAVGVLGKIRQLQPTVPPQYFKKYLSKGRKGSDVKFLQQLLKAHDFYAGNITGTYDDATVAAIKDFQRSKNIKVNGALDLRTRDALNKL